MNRLEFSDLVDLIPSYALRTAATLRIADLIADGNRQIDDIAAAADTSAVAVERLLRYLCCRDIFGWSEGVGYRLTDFSRLLLDDHPSGLRRSLDLESYNGRMDAAIARMPDVLRTGRPSYGDIFGMSVYEDMAAHPELEADFADSRRRVSHVLGNEVAQSIRIEDSDHIVDVGGGTGELLCILAELHSTVTGTVLDVEGLGSDAERNIASHGLLDRINFRSGDFFRSVPPGELHVLCNVLFNWDDRHSAQILTTCLQASTTQRVVVIEHLIGDEATEEELALDLRNLVLNGGGQRTRSQFADLARMAGTEICHVIQAGSGFPVIVEMCGSSASSQAGRFQVANKP